MNTLEKIKELRNNMDKRSQECFEKGLNVAEDLEYISLVNDLNKFSDTLNEVYTRFRPKLPKR